MDQSSFPRMRSISIGEEVEIRLPAHVWLGFLSSYASDQSYNCAHASTICGAIQEAMVDPVYLRERQAEQERQHAKHHEMLSNIIPGIPGPEVPPDISGLEGILRCRRSICF